jgi:Uncharacterised nucleotidyltransferase
VPTLAPYRFPSSLELLCTCISARQRGQSLDRDSAAALTDPAMDLLGLARLAGRHLVTPMLAACLADPELRPRLPEAFALYLEFVHAENVRRNHALRDELGQAAVCLNRLNIEPLVLKGAIHLVDSLYPEPGWRFMRDLDLLIPRERVGQAIAGLAGIGYHFMPDAAEHPTRHRHLAQLGRDDALVVIEIHTELLESRDALPAELVLARARLVELDGARVRVPDAADQLGHLVGHDRFDRDIYRSGFFLLRSVFETALLCQDNGPPRHLLARVHGSPLARAVRVHHALAARLFPDHVAALGEVGFEDTLLAGALAGLERLDENGRLRRFFRYGRRQFGNLVGSRAWRKHFATNIRLPEYRRHCARRLRGLWVGD